MEFTGIKKHQQDMGKSNVPNFNPDDERWSDFNGRFRAYLHLNDIADEKKVSALISALHPKCYALLVNLCRPVEPFDKTFDQLVQLLQEHFEPRPSLITERFKFHQSVQGSNESLNDFVARL